MAAKWPEASNTSVFPNLTNRRRIAARYNSAMRKRVQAICVMQQ
jgi:hypothetical protein